MRRVRRVLLVTSVVLFSLALGIALGGGVLHDDVRTVVQRQVHAATDDAAQQRQQLVRQKRALERAGRFDAAFADEVAPGLADGALSGRTVAVLALPGVPTQVGAGLADDIGAAGGTVTTSLRVGRDLVDPAARPLVDELSQRLLAEVDGLDAGDGSGGDDVYTRVGAVTARALLSTDDGGEAMDDTARSVFNTFSTAGLLSGPEPDQRADTAVLLVPEGSRVGAATAGRQTILTELAAALDDACDGLVVAGPPSRSARPGLVAAVRSAPETADTVSTVDSVGVRAARVVTVLALAEQTEGGVGHYGVGRGADAVLP